MHRVLSYQTAMRANNGRDVREYVSKRTCVSLVLSISFFTLISGFLLGKFVADRQAHMKHIRESDVQLIQKLQIIRETLSEITQNITKHTNQEYFDTPNKEMYYKYMNCIKEDEPNFHDRLDGFLSKLIKAQFSKQIDCLILLENYLKKDFHI